MYARISISRRVSARHKIESANGYGNLVPRLTDPGNEVVATVVLNYEQSRSFLSVRHGNRNANEKKKNPPARSVGAEKKFQFFLSHLILFSFHSLTDWHNFNFYNRS